MVAGDPGCEAVLQAHGPDAAQQVPPEGLRSLGEFSRWLI